MTLTIRLSAKERTHREGRAVQGQAAAAWRAASRPVSFGFVEPPETELDKGAERAEDLANTYSETAQREKFINMAAELRFKAIERRDDSRRITVFDKLKTYFGVNKARNEVAMRLLQTYLDRNVIDEVDLLRLVRAAQALKDSNLEGTLEMMLQKLRHG